jgi:hypothetical protein
LTHRQSAAPYISLKSHSEQQQQQQRTKNLALTYSRHALFYHFSLPFDFGILDFSRNHSSPTTSKTSDLHNTRLCSSLADPLSSSHCTAPMIFVPIMRDAVSRLLLDQGPPDPLSSLNRFIQYCESNCQGYAIPRRVVLHSDNSACEHVPANRELLRQKRFKGTENKYRRASLRSARWQERKLTGGLFVHTSTQPQLYRNGAPSPTFRNWSPTV